DRARGVARAARRMLGAGRRVRACERRSRPRGCRCVRHRRLATTAHRARRPRSGGDRRGGGPGAARGWGHGESCGARARAARGVGGVTMTAHGAAATRTLRIAVTRDESPDGPLASALRRRGLTPVCCAVVRETASPEPERLARAAHALEGYD